MRSECKRTRCPILGTTHLIYSQEHPNWSTVKEHPTWSTVKEYPTDLQSRNIPLIYSQGASHWSAVQSRNIPLDLQSWNIPPDLQSRNIPPDLLSMNIPPDLQYSQGTSHLIHWNELHPDEKNHQFGHGNFYHCCSFLSFWKNKLACRGNLQLLGNMSSCAVQ